MCIKCKSDKNIKFSINKEIKKNIKKYVFSNIIFIFLPTRKFISQIHVSLMLLRDYLISNIHILDSLTLMQFQNVLSQNASLES